MSCERCQAERERAQRIEQDMLLGEQEKRGLLRRINGLTTELKRQRREHPDAQKAKALFDHWTVMCQKNAQTVFGESREKALLARLKQFTEDQLRQAIDGAAAMPYVGDGGRQAHAPVEGARRYDELTLIMRDEVMVERFMSYAQPPQEIEGTTRIELVNDADLPVLLKQACDCGHVRAEHIPPRLLAEAHEDLRLVIPADRNPCAHRGCPCNDFDDLNQRAEAWIAERQAHQRRREMRAA